jgi:hypothetical protein
MVSAYRELEQERMWVIAQLNKFNQNRVELFSPEIVAIK